MHTNIRRMLTVAAAACATAAACCAQNAPAPEPPIWGAKATPMPRLERGFVRIFDGKSLDGWKQCGPGHFDLLPDGSILGRGGMGMLWYTKQAYKDFILKVDWKAEKATSNSGIFVRFPDPGDDPWNAVNQGYEVQICDTGDAKHITGSIYSFAESTFKPSKPYGQWNTTEIRVVGQHYSVRENNKPVCEFDGDRSLEGFVGLQNHNENDRVIFRNVRIKTLTAAK